MSPDPSTTALVPLGPDGNPLPVVPGYRPLPRERWRCSLVITNYNGIENLKAYLPLNMIAVRESPYVTEVIVVDDGSSDNSVEFVRQNFTDVTVVALEQNRGFGNAANSGFRAARNDYVVNISNDMVVTAGYFEKLFENMVSDRIFAVTTRLVGSDGRLQRGRTVPFFVGDFKTWKIFSHEPEVKWGEPDRVYCHFCGAIGLFDKRIFLELGGFDDVFLPFYVEENDLCYRAWKRGFLVLYDPRCWVMHYHQQSGTILRSFKWKVRKVQYKKNRFLFLWKNLTSPHFILLHLVWLAFSFCFSWATGHTVFYEGLRAALNEWGIVKRRRDEELPHFVHSDHAVLKQFSREYAIPRNPAPPV